MTEHREVVFLLGAGATVNAGLPTATGLTKCVEESLDSRDSTKGLLPVLRFISGAIQFGKACRGELPTNTINIEELLTACSFLATRDKSHVYPFVGAWHELIKTLQPLPEELQSDGVSDSFEFLTDYCRKGLHNWLAIRNPAKLNYLWQFRAFTNTGYKLQIFTLNYDECIERALSEVLGDVNDQWTTGFDKEGWNPKLLDSHDYKAYVYKLHGSLDWVNDEELGICSVNWPPAHRSEELPPDYESLLVFGTDIKLQAVDPFLTLLFHFQQLLNSSKVLVVVGYSFGDEHINAMVFEALQRDPGMRCIIVDKSNLDELFSRAPDFRLLVAKQKLYKLESDSAAEAFNSGELLETVESVFKTHEEELPF